MAIYISSGVSSSGLNVNSDSIYVYTGGTINDCTITNHASLYLSGGTVLDTSVTGVSIAQQTGGLFSGGTIGGTTEENCSHFVSGGTARGVTIAAYGAQTVYAGTTVQDTIVSGNGIQTVKSGAAVSGTKLRSKATLMVESGGSALNVYVSSASTIDNGGNIIASVIKGDTKTKITGTNALGTFSLSNGTATNFLVYASAALTVEKGGIAKNTNLRSGGLLEVSAGGSALNTVQSSGGVIFCTVGDDSTTLISGTNTSGTFKLQANVASNFQLYNGGRLNVESNGLASNTQIFANGLLEIQEGGSGAGVRLASGGELFVADDARVTDVVQSAGGVIQLNVDCIKSTFVSGTNERGSSFQLSAGTASGFILTSNSYQYVYDAGEVWDTVVSGGGEISIFWGMGSGITVMEDGAVNLYYGASASQVTLSGGILSVDSGVLKDISVLSGGNMEMTGGTVTNLQIADGSVGFSGEVTLAGTFKLSNEAQLSVSDADVTKSGFSFTFDIVSKATDDVLVDDYSAFAGASGVISCDSTKIGGNYKLAGNASQCTDSFSLRVDGNRLGLLTVNGSAISYQDREYSLSNKTGMLTLTVSEEPGEAFLYAGASVVSSGAMLSDFTLDGAPYTRISVQGGTAQNTVVRAGGSIDMARGKVVSTTMSAGAISVQSGELSSLRMSGGALVLEGGYAETVTLTGGFVTLSGGAFTSGDLSATDVMLSARGQATSRIAINSLVVRGGTAQIRQYSDVNGMTVYGGNVNMDFEDSVNSSGRTTVNGLAVSGGTVRGNAGLVLKNTSVYDGLLFVSQSVYVSGATVYGGTMSARGNTPQLTDVRVSGGKLAIQRATVNTLDITGGRVLFLTDSGTITADGITLAGGVLDILPSNSGGLTLTDVVVKGGTMNFDAANTNQTVTVSNGRVFGGDVNLSCGQVKDLTVTGGTVRLVDGGVVFAGTIELAESAKVELVAAQVSKGIDDSAAKWNFNLTDRTVSSGNMMTGMSFSDAAGYTVTVSSHQADGNYKIVGGASVLNGKTFTLNVGGTAVTGGITVNGADVRYSNKVYTLKLVGGDLSLDVAKDESALVKLYKGSTLVSSGPKFDNITIGGGQYDSVVIEDGGTVTNLTYVSGSIKVADGGFLSGVTINGGASQVVINYEVYDLKATWSGTKSNPLVFSSGAVVHGATISALSNVGDSAVTVKNGAVLYDVVYNNYANSSLATSQGGVISGLTFGGTNKNPIRNRGTVINAEVPNGYKFRFDDSGTLGGGTTGATNISGGTVDLAYTSACLSGGTINFYGGTLLATDSRNYGASIAADTVVNLYTGALIKNSTDILVGGTINFRGGKDSAGTIQTGHSGMTFVSGAALNFYAVNEYMTGSAGRYDKFTNASNAAYGFIVEGTPVAGSYTLLSGAAGLTKNFTITVNNETIGSLAKGQSVKHASGGFVYNYTYTNTGVATITITQVPGKVDVYDSSTKVISLDVVNDVVVDAAPHTKIIVTNGGTANNTIVRKGGTYDQQGGIANGLAVSGGTARISGGFANDVAISDSGVMVISNGTVTGISGAVNVSGGLLINGGTVSDLDVNATSTGAVWINGGTVSNATFKTVTGGLVISKGATMSGLTLSGPAQLFGRICDADLYARPTGEVAYARIFSSGYFDGEVNVHSNAVISVTYTVGTSVNADGQIVGTMNIHKGGAVIFDYSKNTTMKIGDSAVVNVMSGGVLSQGTANLAALVINGTVNLCGGTLKNNTMSGGAAGINLTSGALNFKLAGETAATGAYVANFNAITGKESFACTLDVAANSQQEYILFGTASTFNRTITLSVDGETIGEIGLNTYALDVARSLKYSLTRNSKNQIVVSAVVGGGETAASTGTITSEVNQGADVAATWDNATNYSTGIVTIGNTGDYDHVGLLISNDGTKGASTTLCGGAANADVSAEIDIRLQQGTIGSIVGGARSAQYSVGAVNLTIGGGSAAAKTNAIYAGGMGGVNGDVAIVIQAGAEIAGQVYGGAMMNKANNNVSLADDVALAITGGTLKSDVIGGGRVAGNGISTLTVAGSVDLAVDGGSFTGGTNACIYAGGWVVGDGESRTGADYVVNGGVNVAVSNTTVDLGQSAGRGIFGGAMVSNYGIAEISGDVNISVENSNVGNVFGGGWAQTGASCKMLGDVTIQLTNSTAKFIYGGGAHALVKVETSIAGNTLVDGSIDISVADSTVDGIYAIGQVKGDVVTGDATVTLSGNSVVGGVFGNRHDGTKDVGIVTTLELSDFSGAVTSQLKGFDEVRFSGDGSGVFTCGGSELENTNWTFDLSGNSGKAVVLTWENGTMADDTIRLDLSTENTAGWNICNLAGDDCEGALDNAVFQLYIDGSAYAGEFEVGSSIENTGTALDGMTLSYEEGLLSLKQGNLA